MALKQHYLRYRILEVDLRTSLTGSETGPETDPETGPETDPGASTGPSDPSISDLSNITDKSSQTAV